jgi:hypothetical protein
MVGLWYDGESLVTTGEIANKLNFAGKGTFSNLEALLIKIICIRGAGTARSFPLSTAQQPRCRSADFDGFGFCARSCASHHNFFQLVLDCSKISLHGFLSVFTLGAYRRIDLEL